MKRLMIAFAICLGSLYGFGAKVVHLKRAPKGVSFFVENGFGVQKDGRHELVFTSVATGAILKRVVAFKGTIALEDKKYFSQLDSLEFPSGPGRIKVTGRIFYCSFTQKYCSVQKLAEEI